jgi:Spy/CpxP family protein refolding chaperone
LDKPAATAAATTAATTAAVPPPAGGTSNHKNKNKKDRNPQNTPTYSLSIKKHSHAQHNTTIKRQKKEEDIILCKLVFI